jgi:CRISPR-associated protein Cas5t
MQAIRLKIHQHNAIYRNPSSSEIVESYPLVPPSTVLGLISSILKEMELEHNSFNISIQGNYGALIRDYQWHKKYDDKTKSYQLHRYPLLVHTLYDLDLLLHIYTIDQSLLIKLKRLFENPPYFLYLGRAEDIIKIEEIKITEIKKEKLIKSRYLRNSAYILKREAENLLIQGVVYRLPSFLRFVPITIKKDTKLIRNFEWTEVVYVEKGTRIEIEDDDLDLKFWTDGENLIWWSLPNQPL